MPDLMEQVRNALGGDMPPLLPERYPLSAEITARFQTYIDGQTKRGAEYEAIVARSHVLAAESQRAKQEFFAYLKTQMPDLAGKPIHLNADDFTYQHFADFGPAAANDKEHPNE